MSMRTGCGLAVAAVLAAFVAGCEWDEDDVDHTPPAGQGSIVIDNRTFSDLNVWIDGQAQREAKDRTDTAYDLAPGTHRLVLDQQGGDRYEARDVDVLLGRVTVVEVQEISGDSRNYDIFVRLD